MKDWGNPCPQLNQPWCSFFGVPRIPQIARLPSLGALDACWVSIHVSVCEIITKNPRNEIFYLPLPVLPPWSYRRKRMESSQPAHATLGTRKSKTRKTLPTFGTGEIFGNTLNSRFHEYTGSVWSVLWLVVNALEFVRNAFRWKIEHCWY